MTNNETIRIPQYRIHQKNTANTHTDGTAIAVKHTIPHKIIDTFISDTLAVEINTTTGKIIIATLYQPPARPYIPTPDFLQLFRRNIPVYMISDLNANHQCLGYRRSNNTGRQIYNLIQNHIIQHIGPHFPTYTAANTRTTPDIILTNYRTHQNTHIKPGPLTTSDHTPIILTISTSPIQIPIAKRPSFVQANWENFKTEIENNINTNPFPNTATLEEIDEEIESWYSKILTATRNNIPTTHNRTLPTPQHSHETKLIMTQYTALRTHAHIFGWTRQHYNRYRALQNRLLESLINEGNLHWSQTIAQTATLYRKPETFWKKIKALSGNATPKPLYLIGPNNTRHYKEDEQEQLHRDVWEEVFTDNGEEDDENTTNEVKDFLTDNIHRTFPYDTADENRLNNINNPITEEITLDEIKFHIKRMKKTCPGESGINKTILRHLPEAAIARLHKIFNATVSAGYFPDKWKASTIRLIPKTGKSPHQANNYRPISLLEVPGKLLERIINRKLREHLEDNELHHPSQFGFRQSVGTNHALALTVETIAQYKADGGQCQIILRDITKAFDKVWHLGLKYKILHLGLPITYEKLLCDFLDDRKARIKVGNFMGNSFQLRCGVPQGSVLSPTLFITYTRDLPTPRTGRNISYADDITQIIGYGGKSKEIMNRKTENEIEIVNTYENKWRIKTNINKFTPIRLGQIKGEPLIINDEPIDFQVKGTSLGLKITRTGYTQHVNERRNKAQAALTKLYRLKELPQKIKIHLIKALVLPVLDYPPIPLHTLSYTQTRELQQVQNKALRFATNQRYPYTLNTIQIHTLTRTKPINIRLYERAAKVWKTLEDQENQTYQELKNNMENILKYNNWFPSSLNTINIRPRPIYN